MLYTLIFTLFKKKRRRQSQDLSAESNERLMARYQGGDETAFQLLLTRLERPLFFFILRLISREEVARELVQETFLRVIKHAHRYQPTAMVTTWTYTIAKNLCIDTLRKQRMREISLDQPLKEGEDFTLMSLIQGQSEDGLERAHAHQIEERIQSALQEMNSEQREVFLLREIQGYKFHEIATITGQSENTIKSRMRYALKALRGRLQEYQDEIDLSRERGGA